MAKRWALEPARIFPIEGRPKMAGLLVWAESLCSLSAAPHGLQGQPSQRLQRKKGYLTSTRRRDWWNNSPGDLMRMSLDIHEDSCLIWLISNSACFGGLALAMPAATRQFETQIREAPWSFELELFRVGEVNYSENTCLTSTGTLTFEIQVEYKWAWNSLASKAKQDHANTMPIYCNLIDSTRGRNWRQPPYSVHCISPRLALETQIFQAYLYSLGNWPLI